MEGCISRITMLVGKLNTGQIVLVIKPSQSVLFSDYEHVLVNDNVNARQARWKPYLVISTSVVWILDIGE